MNHDTRPVVRAKRRLVNYALAAFDTVTAWFRVGRFHQRTGSTQNMVAGDSFLRRSWKHGLVRIGVLSIFCLMSPSLFADGVVDDDFGGDGYGEEALLVSLEAANITLAFIATALFFGIARRLGQSREGVAAGYFASGIALLGMTRVFYILADRGVIYVHDDTLEFWWHMIFFMAMAMCIFGGKVLSNIGDERSRLSSLRSLKQWCVISVVVTVVAFLTAEPMDKSFVAVFDGTIWDTFGVQHFVALVVGALALLHIFVSADNYGSRSDIGIMAQLKLPLMITYGLFALDHFWELLTESWEIFVLPETTIERIEQIIVLPAFLAVIYAGWKLRAGRSKVQQAAGTVVRS